VEKLTVLGPAKTTPSGFAWPHKGIDVTSSDGKIQELGFYFDHAAEPGKGAFAGRFQFGGVPVGLSNATGESDVQALFGQPYWRDQDEDEIILFYESLGGEWQLEFELGGNLKHLRVGTPLLADADQRSAYGVTKPWPPEYKLSSRHTHPHTAADDGGMP
jgi:hypothetical protein